MNPERAETFQKKQLTANGEVVREKNRKIARKGNDKLGYQESISTCMHVVVTGWGGEEEGWRLDR